MKALALLLLLLLFAATAAACDGAARRDAEVVLEAIHRFRIAENDAIPARVDALRQTPCNADDTCKARDQCVAIGDDTVKALRLKNEVELSLVALNKGTLSKDSPEALSLPKKLDEAEAFLKQGHEGLPRCDESVQALKRKYHL